MDVGTAERPERRLGITRHESVYLDLVRAVASLTVLLGHATTFFALPGIPLWGHQAVMVFFVLSGYVICHTADTREGTARLFLVSRFARLWSVLVPAMALTIVCDVIGRRWGLHQDAYSQVPDDYPLIRTFAILTFTSESWVSIQPFSNGALWSLCVEFWYYMMFAAWIFIPAGKIRLVIVSAIMIMAGHKTLLLLPIWLMGVALQRSTVLRRLPWGGNLVLFSAGFLIAGWICVTRAYDPAIALGTRVFNGWVMHQLAEARVFWFDWLFGLVVAAHLLGARSVVEGLPLEKLAGPVRWCAGVSFAAYLFHMPLLNLCAAFLGPDQGWLAIVLTLVVIGLLGPSVERSKRWWRLRLNEMAKKAAGPLSQVLRFAGVTLVLRPGASD